MAHHIYQTEAYVCGSKNIGEANRLLYLFTKDLGMISASAQGIRLLKSKLRYSLQDFSYSAISLVKGKHSWKITNAREISSFGILFEGKDERFRLASRIFSLLRRLLVGEEGNEKLFQLLQDGFKNLALIDSLDSQSLKNFECLLVLRILYNLGYCGETEPLKQFISEGNAYEWSQALLGTVSLYRKEALSTINASLSESQL